MNGAETTPTERLVDDYEHLSPAQEYANREERDRSRRNEMRPARRPAQQHHAPFIQRKLERDFPRFPHDRRRIVNREIILLFDIVGNDRRLRLTKLVPQHEPVGPVDRCQVKMRDQRSAKQGINENTFDVPVVRRGHG